MVMELGKGQGQLSEGNDIQGKPKGVCVGWLLRQDSILVYASTQRDNKVVDRVGWRSAGRTPKGGPLSGWM